MTSAPEAPKWLWLHEEDNVAMALSDFAADNTVTVNGTSIVFADAVPYGHKFAVKRIGADEPVIKFAETIGAAKRAIDIGEHVHVHNIRSLRGGAR
ncbi:MAG: UxaA family hydrolase [Hoeflea sp.]|uniref:UxaA family hydrolase n=1 Tax=Hoeflea sp. TaxID=1940281 RepID=UPI00273052C7|nr:UxaA family hydrolase [Hoeflea sp.]MDP2119594.1 UxaA family hydrolase [Hoeflea sp.]